MKKLEPPKWVEGAEALENGKQVLPKVARAYFAGGRRAARAEADWKEMHRFRLMTKHFRYLLELFRPLYGEALEKKIGTLREVQGLLGAINDCQTARELVPEDEGFQVFLEEEFKRRSEAFREYWMKTFDAAGQRKEWLVLLSGKQAAIL